MPETSIRRNSDSPGQWYCSWDIWWTTSSRSEKGKEEPKDVYMTAKDKDLVTFKYILAISNQISKSDLDSLNSRLWLWPTKTGNA